MKVKFEEGQSFLRKVHLIEIPCSLEIKIKGVIRETLDFRFLTPQMSKGHWGFEKDIVAFILEMLGKTEGEEKKQCAHLLRMMRFHRLFPPHEQMRGQRRFHIDFSRPGRGKERTTWFEIARETGIKDAMDFIMYVTRLEKSLPSSRKLLKKAIYREPILKIPFSEESYYRYRQFYMRFWEACDNQAVKVGAAKMFRGEQDPLLDEMRKKNPSGYEKAKESLQESEVFIAREILKNELKDQEKKAKRYGPILQRALGLCRKYMKKDQKNKNVLANSAFSNEFDSLIDEYISQFRADTKREEVLVVTEDEIRTAGKETYIDSLEQSIVSKDASVKWSELVKLIENLTCESNAIRLMQREAEGVCLGLVNYGINETYRKIRKNLTVPEKRVFILAHYRQYKVLGKQSPVFPFGGRIPKLDPVIWDFFSETGETTKVLVSAVLIFKYAPSPGLEKTLAEELRQRWSRYLLFYPSWEGGTRWGERWRKDQKVWKKRTISLEAPVAEDEEGHVVTLRDTLQKNLLFSPEVPERRRNEVCRLIEELCTPRETETLKLNREGYTQQEIAEIVSEKEGRPISQAAISKIIKKAIRKIVEGH